MSQAAATPGLRTHANYERLVALAAESHARGRDPFAATPRRRPVRLIPTPFGGT